VIDIGLLDSGRKTVTGNIRRMFASVCTVSFRIRSGVRSREQSNYCEEIKARNFVFESRAIGNTAAIPQPFAFLIH